PSILESELSALGRVRFLRLERRITVNEVEALSSTTQLGQSEATVRLNEGQANQNRTTRSAVRAPLGTRMC
ncbi:hypothetical protein LCGC14_1945220, partial [marine sediment metagenome]